MQLGFKYTFILAALDQSDRDPNMKEKITVSGQKQRIMCKSPDLK